MYRNNLNKVFLSFISFISQGDNKKVDSKDKAKPKPASNTNETMTTNGGNDQPSTIVDNQQNENAEETSNVIMESQNADDGDK